MTTRHGMTTGLAAVVLTMAGAQPSRADGPVVLDRTAITSRISADARVAVAAFLAARQDHLTTLTNQGAHRYVWARNGLSVPLDDRIGHWTDQEARWVSDGLDLLPDLYIRKAIAGGMHRIYRDGALPTAPTDYLEDVPEGRAGVAVPPAPWNFVAVGDNIFRSHDATYKVITHELGHCVQWSISGWASPITGTPGWTGISWTTGIPGIGLKSWNGFVSDYSRKTQFEDFAECCAWYWLDPAKLQTANWAKYLFMRDVVFERLVSPPAARQDRPDNPAHVDPVITSLGDTSDDNYALVKVHGNFFMGPLDGGFNTVRYRGTSALHLPVSRTTIWSWVPGISTGSAPVTVTTQDGTSNGAAFNVTKPWWKFW
jgi:hypothetical protein